MMSLTLTVNPSLYRKLPYDTVKDLIPVSLIASAPLMLVVNPALPVKSVKERLSTLGAEAVGNSPAEFGAFIRAEIAKWARIVQQAGLKAE